MPLRVLIAGGGTGGHVVPALAIARELRDKHGAEVRFVGTARGLETRLVPEAGFCLELIRVGQLKNVSLMTRARTLFDLPAGLLRCVGLLRAFQPDVVVGAGGYASGPTMMAAILLLVPTLAFEPNAVPGLANRLVGKFVSAAAVNFEPTLKYFRRGKVTGISVRAEFFEIAPMSVADPPKLLVFGGSQGARVFNDVMPKIAGKLLKVIPNLEIVHQAGGRYGTSTKQAYEAAGLIGERVQRRVRVQPYLDDMPEEFRRATLILCRSGASTVAELAAAGRAAVLVPFPGAADDHQTKNAEVFAAAGAAELRVQGSDAELAEVLLQDLTALLLAPERCAAMGRAANGLTHPRAVEEIAGMVVKLSGAEAKTSPSRR